MLVVIISAGVVNNVQLHALYEQPQTIGLCEGYRSYWNTHIISQPNLGGQYEQYCLVCGSCNPIRQGDSVEYYNLRCVNHDIGSQECSDIIEDCEIFQGYDETITFSGNLYHTISCDVEQEQQKIDNPEKGMIYKILDFIENIINMILGWFKL